MSSHVDNEAEEDRSISSGMDDDFGSMGDNAAMVALPEDDEIDVLAAQQHREEEQMRHTQAMQAQFSELALPELVFSPSAVTVQNTQHFEALPPHALQQAPPQAVPQSLPQAAAAVLFDGMHASVAPPGQEQQPTVPHSQNRMIPGAPDITQNQLQQWATSGAVVCVNDGTRIIGFVVNPDVADNPRAADYYSQIQASALGSSDTRTAKAKLLEKYANSMAKCASKRAALQRALGSFMARTLEEMRNLIAEERAFTAAHNNLATELQGLNEPAQKAASLRQKYEAREAEKAAKAQAALDAKKSAAATKKAALASQQFGGAQSMHPQQAVVQYPHAQANQLVAAQANQLAAAQANQLAVAQANQLAAAQANQFAAAQANQFAVAQANQFAAAQANQFAAAQANQFAAAQANQFAAAQAQFAAAQANRLVATRPIPYPQPSGQYPNPPAGYANHIAAAPRQQPMNVPSADSLLSSALSVHGQWASLIIQGKKKIELRSKSLSASRLNRQIPLYDAEAQAVVAVVTFSGCEILKPERFAALAPQHCFPLPFERCTWRVAWFISSVKPLRVPVAFKRQQGSIGWVACGEHLAAIQQQL